MFRPSSTILFQLLAVSLLVTSACDQRTEAPSAPFDAPHSLAAMSSPPDSEYVATPAGWYHRSCVHEIPNGAHVGPSGLVTRPDGSIFQIPKCLHPAYPNLPGASGPIVFAPPTNNGWIEYASDRLPPGNNYAQLTASWKVPTVPTGSYSGTQVFYSFPGIEDIDDPNPYIIQPVIQFGYNGLFGGSYWMAASWRCNSGSDCLYGTPISIAAGDSIFGSVDASACVNGTCTWTISVVDVTRDSRSNWTATDTQNYDWTTGGAVEVYNLNTCNQYPDTGVFYTGISLYDRNGSQVTPAWINNVQPGLDPFCGFDLASTPTTVSLFYNRPPPPPPLTVSMSGPSVINTKGTYTWTANASGGVGGYTYQWSVTYDAGPHYTLGTASSQQLTVYGDDGNFTMYVTVTSGSDQASASKYVNNCINAGGNCPPNTPVVAR